MARKNSDKTVAERRAKIADLHRSGMFQEDIGVLVGVSRSQVSLDLKYLNAQWKREQVGFIDLHKRNQLSSIRRTIKDADESFERSRKVREVKFVKGDKVAVLDENASYAGDPRFLELRLKALEREAKLLGTDAAEKIDATNKATHIHKVKIEVVESARIIKKAVEETEAN